MSRTTILIPHLRGRREDWLDMAIGSFPAGTPYIIAENDGEMAEAMNLALEQVDTEFVLGFGDDDLALPNYLEMLESACWNVDVCWGTMILATEDLEVIDRFPAQPFCGNRLLSWNFVSGAFLARTEMLRKVGGWRDLEALEDWDLHVRMHRAGARFKAVPEAEMVYRRYEGSRNTTLGEFDADEWRQRIVGERDPLKATFYIQGTPITSYLRGTMPAKHLPGKATQEFEYVLTPEDIELSGTEGVPIFQFPGDKFKAMMINVICPELGVPTLIEVDDNYLMTNPYRKRQGWAKHIGKEFPDSIQGHRSIVSKADGVICSTETLARAYRKVNENVFVCRNSVDPDDWPELERPDDGKLRVGWFASWSHETDEVLIRKAMNWVASQKNCEVVLMGIHPSWKFQHRYIPWSNDLATYWRMMMQLDIGVAPVREDPWTICRSDIKALDYAMAGALPLVSAAPPYRDWDDEFRCKGKEDFVKKIKHYVTHPDETRQLAAEARKYVLAERTIQSEIKRWEEAIQWAQEKVGGSSQERASAQTAA